MELRDAKDIRILFRALNGDPVDSDVQAAANRLTRSARTVVRSTPFLTTGAVELVKSPSYPDAYSDAYGAEPALLPTITPAHAALPEPPSSLDDHH